MLTCKLAGLLLIASLTAHATNLLEITGPQDASYEISQQQVIGVAWFQPTKLFNVSINVILSNGLNSDSSVFNLGMAYITRYIGAPANSNGPFATQGFIFPTSGTASRSLFSDLVLDAGSWYLILASNTVTGGAWVATTTPTTTLAPGFQTGQNGTANQGNQNLNNPPASGFHGDLVNTPLFAISGTSTPEPSFAWLTLLSIIAGGVIARKLPHLFQQKPFVAIHRRTVSVRNTRV